MNSWASLPGAADGDVLSRLRQHDDRQFGAAFLELYLFAAFARTSWPCERLTGSGRTPDFRVVAQDGPSTSKRRPLGRRGSRPKPSAGRICCSTPSTS